MTKQRKKTHKSTKIECAEARPNKKDKVARVSGNEVYEGIAELAKKGDSTISVFLSLVTGAAGLYSWFVGHRMIAWCVISLFAAIVLGKVLAVRFKQSVATCVLAAILCFGALTTVSLAAHGYVHVSDKNANESNHGSSDQNQTPGNNGIPEAVLASEAVHESVESTESPQSAREVPFKEQIESQIWGELISEVEKISVTGTQENFESLCEAVLGVMDDYVPEFESKIWRSANHGKLTENTDKVMKFAQGVVNWDNREEICSCREENFKIKPTMINAHLMGQSGLDCLFEMGRVNGKGKKPKNTDIYNKKNIVEYGGVAIDGFAGDWYFEKETGEYGGDSYYLGEVFHHLGDASELTEEALSVVHLVLSAVFYKQNIGDDAIYQRGLATEQQYKRCKNIAIVFDKLDNKIRPEDPYFLLQADRYYTNALYNSNLSSEEKAQLENYLTEVGAKKAKRGLPPI